MTRIAVFGYASLVSVASASRTLGRPIGEPVPARLRGWRRRWSEKRDNLTCEKTFACRADGRMPTWVLGLNVERSDDPADAPNGVLIELSDAELEHLDVREIRYDRVDVTERIEALTGDGAEPLPFDRVIAYSAKPEHFAPEPPEDAVILAAYARAVEDGFATLGPEARRIYLESTGPQPVDVVEADLVRDAIPPGNPRAW